MLEIIQDRMNSYILNFISKIDNTVIVIDLAIQKIVDEREAEEQLLNAFECDGANDTRSSCYNSRIEPLRKFINELVEEKKHLLTLLSKLDRLSVTNPGYPTSKHGMMVCVTNDEFVVQANCLEETAYLISEDIDKTYVFVKDTFGRDTVPEIEKMLESVVEYRVSAMELKDACYEMSRYIRQMREEYLVCEERLMSNFVGFSGKKDISEFNTAMQSRDEHSFGGTAASVPPVQSPYPIPTADYGKTVGQGNKTEASQDAKIAKEKIRVGDLFKRKTKSAVNVQEEQIISPPHIDSIQFSAIATNRVIPGKYLPISIVMYEDAFRESVDEIVRAYGENVKETKSGYHDVERNSLIRVVLTSNDVTIEDDEEEQTWNGKYLNFEFVAKVPKDFVDAQILLTATVYINDIIAAKIKLILDCEQKLKHNIRVTREDIVSAFVSYASQDRNRVASIIQGMKTARPDMDIFFDIESLRSGQKWEEALKNEIESRDVLFLCWSRYARDSKWVDMEWRYALECKGVDSIEPIPIDSPDICPPPVELQQKHFNDKMLFIIKATMPTEEGNHT